MGFFSSFQMVKWVNWQSRINRLYLIPHINKLLDMSESTPSSSHASFVQLSFEVNQETGIAWAVLSETAVQMELSANQIRDQIKLKGIDTWEISEGALDDVLHKFKKHVACRLVIAERKDARFHIKCDEGDMQASIVHTPAKGGKRVTVDEINQALTEKKIHPQRIIPGAVEKLIDLNSEGSMIVARGKSPKVGRDSTFNPLIFHEESAKTPVEDENGRVDFLAGREYLTVSAGTPLMERTPPQPGQMGMDIFGQIIPAEPGKELPFGKELAGTEFASNDPNLLVAAITGHPVFSADAVRVDKTLSFKNVDLTTGHINFDGSLNITGDVMPDMKVTVTGDVFIKGVVERARIKAGNDITVAGGVLGETQTQVSDDAELPELECFLEAGGSVKAKYVNLAQIKAMNRIEIKEYAFNSRLKAGNDILLGQDGGKGNLVGGEAVAGHAVVAKALGNKAYNLTRVRIGITPEDLELFQKIKFLREKRLEQARSLRGILETLKTQGETEKLGILEINKAKKTKETLLRLQEDLKVIDERLRQFDLAHYVQEDQPHVSATSKCYPNCQITINGATYLTNQEHKAITYIKRDRKITAKT